MRRQLATEFNYAWHFRPIRSTLLLLAATSFTVQSFSTLMRWFASERFARGSHTLGFMLAAVGFGEVVAMAYLAMLPNIRGLLREIGLGAVLAGASLAAFAMLQYFWIAILMLFLCGFGMMLTAAGTNTLLQTVASDELRGRVAALYVFTLFPPLGSLASAGWPRAGAAWRPSACTARSRSSRPCQWRGAPKLLHRRHDLVRSVAGRLSVDLPRPAAWRRHLHWHNQGRGFHAHAAGVAQAPVTGSRWKSPAPAHCPTLSSRRSDAAEHAGPHRARGHGVGGLMVAAVLPTRTTPWRTRWTAA